MRRPMCERMEVARGTRSGGEPSMKVSVPAAAPTVPPDMGASRRVAVEEECVEILAPRARESCGEIVEQSI